MILVFLSEPRSFFLWGDDGVPLGLESIIVRGTADEVELVTPTSRARVAGIKLPLVETAVALAAIPVHGVPQLSGSVATWSMASKLALDLVARERVVPTLGQQGGRIVARWGAALSLAEDAARVRALAQSMPPAAHVVPAPGGKRRDVWAPEALLRAFLDAAVDAMVRAAGGGPAFPELRTPRGRRHREVEDDEFTPWEKRWQAALSTDDGIFETEGFAERNVKSDLRSWSEPLLGARDQLRACFRLEMPTADGDAFTLRFLLQSPDDPSLLITAGEAWSTKGRSLAKLGRAFSDPQGSLLQALGRAARIFAPLTTALHEARPECVELDPAAAWQFLSEGAPALADTGFGVIVPAELTAAGQRRLRLRMRVSGGSKVVGAVAGGAGVGLDALLHFEWEVALGDQSISARELKLLAKHKMPLVRYRGQWVAIDPRELAEFSRRLTQRSGTVGAREAIIGALAGEVRRADQIVAVTVDGAFAELIGQLREGAGREAHPPEGFTGTLRPYQARGLAWLKTMGTLGLGACLADDMGLGKTIQLLAFLLSQANPRSSEKAGPSLLVAPTSVLGNWEREAARFAPELSVLRHYGADRAQKATDIPQQADTLVITSYGVLRRDERVLSEVPWSTVALDEAQNIKNAASATAKAARSLVARHRFALTGTPVENRLAELWSIFEFANPGLLGPLDRFRREFAVPIERYGNEDAAARLRKIASPFLLRRLKSDPAIIRDLPPKNEMKVICTLSREQATLYQAVVDEEMRRIELADGIERRGRVLALVMFLKQICNHPAQYLGEPGPLARRSGKLDRSVEMLEEAMAEGDKALVFTQFREMGDRLVRHFEHRLGVEVLFLHGGTPRKKRDEMVRRFQEEPYGPRVFVLSVKAGGTGLNLTAANHVFHYDRWWNPAVEDQATDRAYRIGQKRSVQVHKFVCAGTLEEKVDRMLDQKRGLAEKVIGAGEQWITEFGNDELRELFALSSEVAADIENDEPERDEHLSQGRKPRRRQKREVEVRS